MKTPVCVGKITKGKREFFYAPVFDIDLQNSKGGTKMKIQTLQKITYKVELSELYIKPFYKGDIVEHYSICSNERNQEIELGSYSDKKLAEHMLNLIELYKDCPSGISILEEDTLHQDLVITAAYKFKKSLRDMFDNGTLCNK